MPAPLLEYLDGLLAAHPAAHRLVVGYSGGLDSHVLLHLLATHRASWPERSLAAVYVDHRLQAASTAWGEHCARVCRDLDVPFRVLRISARPGPGESPEAAARRAPLRRARSGTGAGCRAADRPSRDDQAETLLLQLLRGAGPHGLAAMPATARLGRGWLLRPLLDLDRAEVLAYARERGLRWIEDASNADTGFDRNYLRHRILPLLRERWPAAKPYPGPFCPVVRRNHRLAGRRGRRRSRLRRRSPPRRSQPLGPARTERTSTAERAALLVPPLGLAHARQPATVAHPARYSERRTRPAALCRLVGRRGPTLPGYAVRHAAAGTARRATNPDLASQYRRLPPLELPGVGWLRMEEIVGAGLRAEALAGGLLLVRFRQGGNDSGRWAVRTARS